jgi:NifU-like protein involved in Fe-S cluster formation
VFVLQVSDASNIKNADIAKELSLPPVKLHCSSMEMFNVDIFYY